MANIFKKIINKFKKNDDDKVVKELSKKNSENSFFKETSQEKFDNGLRKSSSNLDSAITNLLKKYNKSDESFYDEMEEMLLLYDVGYNVANKITESVKDEVYYQNIDSKELIKEILIDKIFTYYIQDSTLTTNINLSDDKTNVILIIGANGVGKTTSIAKITKYLVDKNKKVLLVAGDTFRAGAVEQLKVWSERLGVDIILPQKEGQETASVIYQGLEKGYKENYDFIICDTSGRLQNKVNLMNELKKVYDIIHKFDQTAPHESLLVIDATTGQSGLSQAKLFNDVANLSGIILTKMDSTSKGGIILSIKDMFNIPVKFIGLGESIDDLEQFDLEKFIIGLLSNFK